MVVAMPLSELAVAAALIPAGTARWGAVAGQGGLVDPHLTEDPSTAAAHPEVQEQEDFFEGV
jgi:hypothetical protein